MTIKVLFFPFTHIIHNHLSTLLAFFPSFQYLPVSDGFNAHSPLQNLVEQGKIDPVFSSSKQISEVKQSVKDYLSWAQIHRGSEMNLRSLLKDTPYFTSDTQVSAIKSQIKGVRQEASSSVIEKSDRQRDLLFLRMAHLFDRQTESLDRELRDLDQSRDRIVSALRGLETPVDTPLPPSGDPGAIMTRERICAWARCMTAEGGWDSRGETVLFVTTSRAVFDYLESNCEDHANPLDIERIKVHENECENTSEWQRQLGKCLMSAIQGDGNPGDSLPEVNDGCSLSGQIKLGFFSGNEINKLFNVSNKSIPVCLIKLK